jgi:hypothetical protein
MSWVRPPLPTPILNHFYCVRLIATPGSFGNWSQKSLRYSLRSRGTCDPFSASSRILRGPMKRNTDRASRCCCVKPGWSNTGAIASTAVCVSSASRLGSSLSFKSLVVHRTFVIRPWLIMHLSTLSPSRDPCQLFSERGRGIARDLRDGNEDGERTRGPQNQYQQHFVLPVNAAIVHLELPVSSPAGSRYRATLKLFAENKTILEEDYLTPTNAGDSPAVTLYMSGSLLKTNEYYEIILSTMDKNGRQKDSHTFTFYLEKK